MLAADAGSTNTLARGDQVIGGRISSSVAARKRPFDCCWASTAEVHEAGAPIRIAVAMVSGSLTGSPRTSGAALLPGCRASAATGRTARRGGIRCSPSSTR